MARRYRRAYRRFRKSGRWAVNIQEVENTISAPAGVWYHVEDIMVNPSQVNTFSSQTYTIKNVEFSFTLQYEGEDWIGRHLENVVCYIMFVPQGMTVTKDFNIQHPEYIMAYKLIGSPQNEYTIGTVQPSDSGLPNQQIRSTTPGQQFQPMKIKTRLSRKLQTGDSVILFVKGGNQSIAVGTALRLCGVLRWWTKAN